MQNLVKNNQAEAARIRQARQTGGEELLEVQAGPSGTGTGYGLQHMLHVHINDTYLLDNLDSKPRVHQAREITSKDPHPRPRQESVQVLWVSLLPVPRQAYCRVVVLDNPLKMQTPLLSAGLNGRRRSEKYGGKVRQPSQVQRNATRKNTIKLG